MGQWGNHVRGGGEDIHAELIFQVITSARFLNMFGDYLRQKRIYISCHRVGALVPVHYFGLIKTLRLIKQYKVSLACLRDEKDLFQLSSLSLRREHRDCLHELWQMLQDSTESGAMPRLSLAPIAARLHQYDLMYRAIDNGCDVNAQDWNGSTCLHHLAEHGSLSETLMLIGKGANANIQDDAMETPIEVAETEEVMLLLIDHSVDLNGTQSTNEPPLHRAILCGFLSAAIKLLQKGACSTISDRLGRTSLQRLEYFVKRWDQKHTAGSEIEDSILKLIRLISPSLSPSETLAIWRAREKDPWRGSLRRNTYRDSDSDISSSLDE